MSDKDEIMVLKLVLIIVRLIISQNIRILLTKIFIGKIEGMPDWRLNDDQIK